MALKTPMRGSKGRRALSIPVQHAWFLRMLRTCQFGIARATSRDGFVEAHAAPFGLTFTGPAADCITRHIYRIGAHEPHITRYLLDNVSVGSDEVALDVGANIGWYSVLLDRLSAPGARVLAFEPDPGSYRLLRANLKANRTEHVTALNVALGDKPGVALLHRYRDSNNGRHTLLDGNTSGGTVEVPVETLKDIWDREQLGARRVALLKIDVEGFECLVLRGAGDILKRCRYVLLEYSPEGLKLAGLPPEAIIDLLVTAGLEARVFAGTDLVRVSYAELARADSQKDLLLTPTVAR
jgi:FkbM family methyltransferase